MPTNRKIRLGGKTPLAGGQDSGHGRRGGGGRGWPGKQYAAALPAGSDTANLSLLGYDPLEHFTGRAPLEAAAQGIELGPNDWAVRCNLVTIEDQVMKSFTAGHISTEEAAELLRRPRKSSAARNFSFYPGVSYRNLLIYRGKDRPVPFSSRHPHHCRRTI